jgi:DMSO/TMAO reductase YedYZ molybdopterin-dependent catalytic subunit
MQRISSSIMILLAITFAGHYIFAQEAGSLVVRGAVLKPGPWSPQDIKQRFADQIQPVKFTGGKDKQPHVGTGIPLISLLQEAAPKTEKVPKHYDLSFLVIIEAHDSYRAFFSLAELLPGCGNAQAFLIWDVDGKPLSADAAPFRLIVSSDRGHDRNIYGIASITLVDGTKLASQLAAGKQPQ